MKQLKLPKLWSKFKAAMEETIYNCSLRYHGIEKVDHRYFPSKTPLENIHLKLVNLAKEKLYDSDKSINEIAYELGFRYQQHFTRMFKKETGQTPNEYRSLN